MCTCGPALSWRKAVCGVTGRKGSCSVSRPHLPSPVGTCAGSSELHVRAAEGTATAGGGRSHRKGCEGPGRRYLAQVGADLGLAASALSGKDAMGDSRTGPGTAVPGRAASRGPGEPSREAGGACRPFPNTGLRALLAQVGLVLRPRPADPGLYEGPPSGSTSGSDSGLTGPGDHRVIALTHRSSLTLTRTCTLTLLCQRNPRPQCPTSWFTAAPSPPRATH